MNYLFISEDCLNCVFFLKILEEKDSEKWTRCLTLVYVKSDEEGNLKTFINENDVGYSPVMRVPALYLRSRDELIVGADEVFGELSNANWFC
jgi:hypothetical protein